MRIAVLASGRGSNLQAILDAIERKRLNIEVAAVISDQVGAKALDKAAEWGIRSYVLAAADFSNRREYDLALTKLVEETEVDYVALAGFMRIVGQEFVNRFTNRIINIHPSLLPAFPGLAAQQQALEYGVKVSGCTVHFVDLGMDTGPIIAQAAVPVEDDDTVDSLSARILQQEHRLYPFVLDLLAKDKVEIKGRSVKINN